MTTATLPAEARTQASGTNRTPQARDPRWARPAVLALLLGTLALYLWNLSASGWANSFYSAAVQAGSESWKAFFFGSSDASNFITVDKPPAALWPMELSVRILGLSSWAILVPEALMGTAAVGVLYLAVRRRFGPVAGLTAGVALALTPVAALMFRYNNPEALLTLLMVCAVYCVQRALEQARTRWLLLGALCVGFGFLTKTLQAFLILPALALVYGVCAPARLRRRLVQLALALAVVVVSGGWWVAVVELWPASSRPYIGGSQDNSFLSLTFGYNGLGRLTGDETGSLGGTGNSSETGLLRMFTTEMGGQISWLLPAALILLVAGVWAVGRGAGRTDPRRSALLVWGGSLLCTFAVFDFMSGIFHAYYTIALAPYIAAVTGMGAALLWQRRREVLGAVVAVTAVWSYVLLARASGESYEWLRWPVLVGGLVAAAAIALSARLGRAAARGAVALALVTALAGPSAYTLTTVSTAHTGALPTAGPSSGPGGMGGGPRGGGPQGGGMGGNQSRPGGGALPGGTGTGNGAGNGTGTGTGSGPGAGGATGSVGGGGMNIGSLLNGVTVSARMTTLLKADASHYTWTAAVVGSNNAAAYQLASGAPVMAVGGFNGTDPAPSLARFKKYVAEKKIHYFVSSGTTSSGSGTAAQITAWVAAHFTAKTVGGATVYDLTQ